MTKIPKQPTWNVKKIRRKCAVHGKTRIVERWTPTGSNKEAPYEVPVTECSDCLDR